MNYTSELLKHEADHYDNLIKEFPDLRINMDERGSCYYSNLTNPKINHIIISNNGYKIYGDLVLKLNDCDICTKYYGYSEWLVNNNLPRIDIALLTGEIAISLCHYEDYIDKHQINPELINKIDLYIVDYLQKNTNIKEMQLNSRIRKLLTFA